MSAGVLKNSAQILLAGDELVFTSDVTPHVRRFCAVVLRGLGVTSTAFPADASPAQLEILFRDRVSGKASASRIKAVLVQGLAPPGMRLPDLAEISRVAHENGAIVVYDNTWMIGWAYDAIAHGADVVVCGGDGALSSAGGPEGVGLVTCTEGRWREVRAGCKFVGLIAAPDDAYKVLRDMRTLPFRMHTQDAAARRLAGFLAAQSSRVENVQHISLPNHPNHRLWQDTCRGAPPFVRFSLSGGVAVSEEQASRFLEALRLVQIGGGDGGWGGDSTMIWPVGAVQMWDRRLSWAADASDGRPGAGSHGPTEWGDMLLCVGLESADDIMDDIAAALDAL